MREINLQTEEELHEELLYSLWQGGAINLFELEAERQCYGLSTMHIRRKDYLFEEDMNKQLAGELMNRTHYQQKKGKVEICVNGNLAKCQLPITRPIGKIGSGRGSITGFSRQSRSRMMKMAGRLEKAKRPLFFTLTYPDEFLNQFDGHELKEKHLKNFWKRMEYGFDNLSCIWKLEYKPRKSGENVGELYPHFHLMVWGLYDDDIFVLRDIVARAWWEVCGKLSDDHLEAGTRVERMRSEKGTMFYLAKYMGKMEGEDLQVGRWWGVKGRNELPLAKVVIIDFLNQEDYERIIDFMAFYAGLPRGEWNSLEIFIDGRKFLQELDKIIRF